MCNACDEKSDISADCGSACACGSCGSSPEHGATDFPIRRIIFGAGLFAVGLAIHFGSSDFGGRFSICIFAIAYWLCGGDILLSAIKNFRRGKVCDENFLMAIASLGAFAIGEYAEAVGVMLFYQVGEYFQERAAGRAKREITALLDLRPPIANVYRDGKTVAVAPDDVEIGETLLIRAGEKIPLDATIISGNSALDTSALTGESLPKTVKIGDSVLSGMVNLTGVLTARVEKKFADSAIAKIMEITRQAAEQKAPLENFFTRFAKIYTPLVVGVAVALAFFPPLFGTASFREWIHRALILLVISCPCALVVSIPLTFFAALGASARSGALVRGGNFLEALTQISTVIFDKTGTLTRGKFTVAEILPKGKFSADELLTYAAGAEWHSPHPLAQAIRAEFSAHFPDASPAVARDFCEIAGRGATAEVNDKRVLIGNEALIRENKIAMPPMEPADSTEKNSSVGVKIFIAIDGYFAGQIKLSDQVKPDARAAIAELKNLGVSRIAMLTGDHRQEAARIANELAITEFRAELLPTEKYAEVEKIFAESAPSNLANSSNATKRKRAGGKVVFIGDGINDAPALARADVGVAMGQIGTDVAIAQADVVLMRDEIGALPAAMKIARRARKIAWQNVGLSLGVKSAVMVLGIIGAASMWLAIFADVGVALPAILNAIRAGKWNETVSQF